MSTSKSTYTRNLLAAAAFAAFALTAEASQAADSGVTTQARVQSVVAGTRSDAAFDGLTNSGVASRGIEESTRQVLQGTQHFNGSTHVVSRGVNADETLKLTQRVVLGRVAS